VLFRSRNTPVERSEIRDLGGKIEFGGLSCHNSITSGGSLGGNRGQGQVRENRCAASDRDRRGRIVHPLERAVTLTAKPGYEYAARPNAIGRSEEHTSELQSRENLVCRLLL